LIREIAENDFGGLMTLYMQLHGDPFPERAGFNRKDKTAFIRWL
jgi:hypothetical protein